MSDSLKNSRRVALNSPVAEVNKKLTSFCYARFNLACHNGSREINVEDSLLWRF